VRGVMAEEARRSKLVSSMQDLQASLEHKGTRTRRGKTRASGKPAP
jgi:hypothetical protein